MLCRHSVFGASELYRDVGELLMRILPSPHTRPTEPDCARSARPELGTVAEKPPRIGSSCVTVPPSDRTRRSAASEGGRVSRTITLIVEAGAAAASAARPGSTFAAMAEDPSGRGWTPTTARSVRATAAASDRTLPCKRTVGRAMAAALTATVIRLLHPLGNFPIRNEGQCRAPGADAASSGWATDREEAGDSPRTESRRADADAEVARRGSSLAAQVLWKVNVAKGAPLRIERAPCALAESCYPESVEERHEAPLPPAEQGVRRLARRLRAEDHRQRPQGPGVLKSHSACSRPPGLGDHLQEHGRGHVGHVACRDEGELGLDVGQPGGEPGERAPAFDRIARHAQAGTGGKIRFHTLRPHDHHHLKAYLQQPEHGVVQERHAPVGLPQLVPAEPGGTAPGQNDAGDGIGVLPGQRSASGRAGSRFCTNSKPNRPLMHRCPRVMSWSSGEVTFTIALSWTWSSRSHPTPQ